MSNAQKPLTARRLPGGDIWMPNNGKSDANVAMETDVSQVSVVQKVVETNSACPFCGLVFKGNGKEKKFKAHLEKDHASAFRTPEEKDADAAKHAATKQRAAAATGE